MSDVVYTDFKPTIIFSYDIIFCLHLVRFSQEHYIIIGINTLCPKYINRYHLSKEKITDIDNFFGSKLIFICLTKLCPRSSFRQIFGFFFFFPFFPFSIFPFGCSKSQRKLPSTNLHLPLTIPFSVPRFTL